MKYYAVAKRAKDFFKLFYSHTNYEISRMKLVGIDLEKYSKEKPYKFCKDSYKIGGFLNGKYDQQIKIGMHNLINEIDDCDLQERSQSYEFIRGFADILLYAEKFWFYQNDDSKEMWAIQHDENLVSVFFEINDATIECKFQKSAINIKSKNMLDEFLNDKSENNYEIFVEVEITRHFGNEFVSNFKSILGSNEFNLNNDEIYLMEFVEIQMREIMIKTLHEILEHILRNCLKIENLTVEDFENGVELWRSR